MGKLTDSDFYSQFEGRYAVSALAVLQERDKIRVLHDASNRTEVNHRIRCRDKVRMPGVREKNYLLNLLRDKKEVAFSLLGDFSKAHRRVKIHPSEWGFQACKLDDGFIWFNKVGTFGVSSIAYWWARLSGALIRAVYSMLGPLHPLELLLFADDLELLACCTRERESVALAIFYFILLGAPFKWSKFRGGHQVDWVGLHTCYKSYSIGLSASRAAWVISWIEDVLKVGKVNVRDAAGATGRINFAALALTYEKPLLGILYLWIGSVLGTNIEVAVIPWAVRLVLKWITVRLQDSGRLQAAPRPYLCYEDLFRSDAKAEDNRAFVGGWMCAGGLPSQEAPWFALEITEDYFPWAFCKRRDPGRVIAALELLGTILCMIFFGKFIKERTFVQGVLSASTDNQGNTYAITKLLSTKFPLTVLVVELSEQLRAYGTEMSLVWRRRDINQEADDLTNTVFDKFDMSLRIEVDPKAIPWIALPLLMTASQSLYEDVVAEREGRKGTAKVKHSGRGRDPTKKLKFTNPW